MCRFLLTSRLLTALTTAALLAGGTLTAPVAAETKSTEIVGKPGILLELFTSQGCYSCPPADELLRTVYAQQDDLIPLEFHVDYWDDLIYGFSGSWKDPFSSPDYTSRQRAYNLHLRDTASMYTPQLVLQGQRETVGSRQGKIDPLIAELRGNDSPPLTFRFSGSASDGWNANISGTMQGNENLYYAIFIREHATDVQAGENKGKRMINSHVVTQLDRQRASRRQIQVPAYDPATEGCAVWVQQPQTGDVIAAAQCP